MVVDAMHPPPHADPGSCSRPDRPGSFPFALEDGSAVLLAPVIPEDQRRIRDGLARMSSISRYLRFFTATPQLSDEQLHYLANVDQVNHVAWAALDPGTPGLDGLGLGRFVRLEAERDVAEFAIAVVDAWQSRGLGRVLLGMLCLQAAARNIRTLRGLALPENQALRRWLGALGARERCAADACEIDLPVPSADAAAPPGSARRRLLETMRQLASAAKNAGVPMEGDA